MNQSHYHFCRLSPIFIPYVIKRLDKLRGRKEEGGNGRIFSTSETKDVYPSLSTLKLKLDEKNSLNVKLRI
jgi:hypothetical protein